MSFKQSFKTYFRDDDDTNNITLCFVNCSEAYMRYLCRQGPPDYVQCIDGGINKMMECVNENDHVFAAIQKRPLFHMNHLESYFDSSGVRPKDTRTFTDPKGYDWKYRNSPVYSKSVKMDPDYIQRAIATTNSISESIGFTVEPAYCTNGESDRLEYFSKFTDMVRKLQAGENGYFETILFNMYPEYDCHGLFIPDHIDLTNATMVATTFDHDTFLKIFHDLERPVVMCVSDRTCAHRIVREICAYLELTKNYEAPKDVPLNLKDADKLKKFLMEKFHVVCPRARHHPWATHLNADLSDKAPNDKEISFYDLCDNDMTALKIIQGKRP